MANDLSINLGSDVSKFQQGMRQAGNSLKNLEGEAKRTNSRLASMQWGMIANQLAVGIQDAAGLLANGGTFSQALNAMSNNVIQLLTLWNPMAGAIGAAAIAAYQLWKAFDQSAIAAKNLAEFTKQAEESAARMGKKRGEEAVGHVNERIDDEMRVGSKEEVRARREVLKDDEAWLQRKLRLQEQERTLLLKAADAAGGKDHGLAEAAYQAAAEEVRKTEAAIERLNREWDTLAKLEKELPEKTAKRQRQLEEESEKEGERRHRMRMQRQAAEDAMYEKSAREEQQRQEEAYQKEVNRRRNLARTGGLGAAFMQGSAEEVSLRNRNAAQKTEDQSLQKLNEQVELQKQIKKAIETVNRSLEKGISVETVA